MDDGYPVCILQVQLLCHFQERNMLMLNRFRQGSPQLAQKRFKSRIRRKRVFQNGRMINGSARLRRFPYNRHADQNVRSARIFMQERLNTCEQNHKSGQRSALAHLKDALRHFLRKRTADGCHNGLQGAWSFAVRQPRQGIIVATEFFVPKQRFFFKSHLDRSPLFIGKSNPAEHMPQQRFSLAPRLFKHVTIMSMAFARSPLRLPG